MASEAMKPGTRRYTCETIRSGQPRPYADSLTEFTVLVEWIPYANPQTAEFVPNTLNEELVKRIAKGLVPFKEQSEKPDWHEPQLTSFKKVGDAKWHFVVTTVYTD